MGKKGSETFGRHLSLILTDDDLDRMVDAVAMGRKIYSNLKKAIYYIISIHIPIILNVFVPAGLGWKSEYIHTGTSSSWNLSWGPTCSIIYENEPIEKNIMQQKPRIQHNLLPTGRNWPQYCTGLAITAGTLFVYQYSRHPGNRKY